METLMWRASNVVIASGVASGTQVKEKTNQQSGGKGVEKATTRLAAEKKSAAAGAATGGGNGRRFALAPLPFPSARNLVLAPLRFLWFPESKNKEAGGKNGVGAGGARIGDVIELLDAEQREKEAAASFDAGGAQRELFALKPEDLGLPPKENSAPKSGVGKKNELGRFEYKNAAIQWFQNVLNVNFNVNFLRRDPRIDAGIPSAELLESAAASAARLGEGGPAALEQKGGTAGKNAVADPRGGGCEVRGRTCAGCASEDGAAGSASPLSALEVPHLSVKHDFESFSKFLSDVPLVDLKVIAQASFLCNLAYVIPEIKAGELARYHRMLFVTSSVDIKARAIAKEKVEAIAKEKAAAAAAAAAKQEAERNGNGASVAAKKESNLSPARVYALATAAVSAISALRSQKKESAEAAVEDVEDASSTKRLTNPMDSDSMEAFLGTSGGGGADESSSDMPAFMRPVTSVVSAEKETRQEVADNLRSLHTCPCEWFACDEKGGPTRFFSIQGSESFASWQANLLFEPMQFEDPELGVMVHRGIYEAALGLYDQLLPFVVQHLERYGDSAKFQFTGHSLGGSLAVLLSLMLNIRGVLKTTALLPVYTFGAPYIMCGGDYLMKKLGLPPTHVQYVVMHRDIVPRAFACNYPDHIAEVLKTLNGTFRDHSCLTQQRLLYAPMGQLMVLQPDQRQATPHPLLPPGTGLYRIRHQSHNEPTVPDVPSRAVEVRSAQRAFLNQPHPLEIISDPASYGSAGSISRNHDPRSYAKAVNGVLRQEMKRWRRVQRERRRQLWWPLISADVANASARKSGSISRNHDPRSYAKAVNGVLRQEMKRWRRVQRERRRQLWWPLISADVANASARKSGSFGAQREQQHGGCPKGGSCGPSGLRNSFGGDLAQGRAVSPASASGDRRGRFSRYKSLIASRHVQMGLLMLVFMAQTLLKEGFATFLTWV